MPTEYDIGNILTRVSLKCKDHYLDEEVGDLYEIIDTEYLYLKCEGKLLSGKRETDSVEYCTIRNQRTGDIIRVNFYELSSDYEFNMIETLINKIL